ncbi:MAG: PIG-L deacetylase family protein [Thermomicrobiales bacterium]
MSDEKNGGEDRPRRVLVSMAHPDDIEFNCGATIAKWADEGQEVFFVLGTSGDKGSDDPEYDSAKLMETREAEQRAAADVLGVKDVMFLRFKDAELMPDLELRKEVTRAIRHFKPDAVVCQDPAARYFGNYIQHPDHVAMGEATLAAIYPSARDRLTFPELLAEGYEPHKVTEIYVRTGNDRADHFVEITDYLDKKAASLREHKSQLGDWDPLESVTRWARDTAAVARHMNYPASSDMKHAESFRYIAMSR